MFKFVEKKEMAINNKNISGDDKLNKYIKPLIDKEHSYHRGNLIDDETFLQIAYEWVDWFEKKIDTVSDNTHTVIQTGADTGYSSIGERWGDFRKTHNESYTKESIAETYRGFLTACIAHLYQATNSGSKKMPEDWNGGATDGCMYCSCNVDFTESELKAVKFNVVPRIQMGMRLQCHGEGFIKMYK